MFRLIQNMGAFVALAIVLNAVIFLLGWGAPESRVQPSFAPPGWVIGSVWITLFALLGWARWSILMTAARGARERAREITFFVFLCAAYPVYTMGLSNLPLALAGNFITILAAAWIAWRVRQNSVEAVSVLSLVIIWVLFATVLVIRSLQLNA